jgi:D-glycero-D-manno-heptose 1,7-bisphosphate phosphatase
LARPAVFIDRDGTISHEVGYVNHLSRFRIYPWSVEAVRLLNRAGILAVVATNQAGVARGYYPESMVHAVHAELRRLMEEGGARLDGLYACLHHPSVGEPPYRQDCQCRKPRPGLLLQAAAELDIDLGRSWMVGDRGGDVALAHKVGARGALVLTGYGRGELEHLGPRWPAPPDLVAENLLDAVRHVIEQAT